MQRLGILAGLLVCACGSPDKQPAAAPANEPADVAAPTAPDDATAAAPPAKDTRTREQLVAHALARVAEIQTKLGELRGSTFKANVPAEYQSQHDFQAFVVKELERELPAEKSDKLARALHQIGLLPELLDLATTLRDALVSQAGAYYDPTTKKFYLVMVPNSDLLLDTISSHELMHALQDQYFDLQNYYGQGPTKPTQAMSEDELNARRFVVEGEASLMMTVYSVQAMAKIDMLQPATRAQLETQLQMMAKLDPTQLASMTRAQTEQLGDLGEEMEKALEALDDIPLYIIVPLLESYTKGTLPVYAAYAHGGWEAVAELYSNPPASTEQVLHPKEKLVPKRDDPTVLTLPKLPALKGWSVLHDEVTGELLWRVYFLNWNAESPDVAAAGWDGDRVVVYGKDDATVGVVATVWDSPDEASEFAQAYLASLTVRFPDGETTAANGVSSRPRGDGTSVWVEQKGPSVYIVDGADEAMGGTLVKALAKTKKTPYKRRT